MILSKLVSSLISYMHTYGASLGVDRAEGRKKKGPGSSKPAEAENLRKLRIIHSNVNLHYDVNYTFVKIGGKTCLYVDL